MIRHIVLLFVAVTSIAGTSLAQTTYYVPGDGGTIDSVIVLTSSGDIVSVNGGNAGEFSADEWSDSVCMGQ